MQIDITKPEFDVIIALMDAGVRAAGLQAMRPELLSVVEKLAAAAQAKPSEGDAP